METILRKENMKKGRAGGGYHIFGDILGDGWLNELYNVCGMKRIGSNSS
jgi:hypothetical protein